MIEYEVRISPDDNILFMSIFWLIDCATIEKNYQIGNKRIIEIKSSQPLHYLLDCLEIVISYILV